MPVSAQAGHVSLYHTCIFLFRDSVVLHSSTRTSFLGEPGAVAPVIEGAGCPIAMILSPWPDYNCFALTLPATLCLAR